MFLAESISSIRTIPSVGKLELEQTSLLKFIFQITNEFEFWNLSNSMFTGFLLLLDTTVLWITLHTSLRPADITEGSSLPAGNCRDLVAIEIVSRKFLSRPIRQKVLLLLFPIHLVLLFAQGSRPAVS